MARIDFMILILKNLVNKHISYGKKADTIIDYLTVKKLILCYLLQDYNNCFTIKYYVITSHFTALDLEG